MILGFYGPQDSGKTTLIEAVIRGLGQGHSVATVKLIHEPGFSIDRPGKDTARHGAAGAISTVASAPHETSFMVRERRELDEILEELAWMGAWDVVLVEGFRDAKIPKVKVGGEETTSGTVLEYHGDPEEVVRLIKEGLRLERGKGGETRVRLKVNGRPVPLGKFAADVFSGALVGMVAKLKDVPEPRSIQIEVEL